jgi:AhpD family alkylhydroperoxidase
MVCIFRTVFAISTVACSLSLATAPTRADDMSVSRQAITADIQKTFGSVPSFIQQVPDAALPGFWSLVKELEVSDKTVLPAKTKALISLAVASQIPCEYCIYADTLAAKQHGATDAEIGEAVSMAGLTRYASTTFHGMQVDFAQFKKEMGGQ